MRHPAFSLECGLFNIVPYDKVRPCTTVEEVPSGSVVEQGSHRLEKYLHLEGFLEKSLKNKFALKRSDSHSKALKSP